MKIALTITLILALSTLPVTSQVVENKTISYEEIIKNDDFLSENGGVRTLKTADGGFIIISVAHTTNTDRMKRITIAQAKALRELIAHLEGLTVESSQHFTEDITTNDSGSGSVTRSEESWSEEIIIKIKGGIRALPVVAKWTDEEGNFFLALGGRFTEQGERVFD